MFSPVSDWSDMVDFDYENEGLRGEMIKAMKHWVTVADVDGFRCDGAMLVPQKFWESVRLELEKLKPEIFMLAEAEQPSLHHKAFDMSYSWEFLRVANNIAEGDMKRSDLESYMLQAKASFVVSAYRMYFTTNHDENTLNGTVFERFGAAHKLYAVLAFTLDGMPLLYSGQEAGNPKRLASFEKDTIVWGEYMFQDFYTDLLHAKKENEALWNGSKGGPFERINTNKDEQIFAYTRVKNDNRIVVFLNFSDAQIQFETEHVPDGKFRNIFGDKSLFFFINDEMSLEPWGFQVFVSETKSKTKSADS
jgi:glycosidase